ncbi:MAG: hypothetical protein EOP52_11830 [Sphingobacteriales bacterium]|nr:MAG: hypothetical protein EOP52_11830 [Sphingobacteriales bacterium]
MNPVDEIRMQAFMLGNGKYYVPCFTIFLLRAILLPDLWGVFYQDYRRGRKSKPIKSWTIDEYAHCSTDQLKSTLTIHSHSSARQASMGFLVEAGSYIAIVAGVFGMVFCPPYLFSSNTADLVGAGFPFVGGAIFTGSGLIALSNINRRTSQLV